MAKQAPYNKKAKRPFKSMQQTKKNKNKALKLNEKDRKKTQKKVLKSNSKKRNMNKALKKENKPSVWRINKEATKKLNQDKSKVINKSKKRKKLKVRKKKSIFSPKLRRFQFLASYILIAIALIAILIGIIVYFVAFRIDDIKITGTATYYSQEDILKNVGVSKNDSILTCDADKVKQNIRAKLPYLDIISVKKNFPDTLLIDVCDAEVKANVEYEGDYVYIDKYGKIMGKGESTYEKAILIKGVELVCADVGTEAKYSDENAKNIVDNITSTMDKYEIDKITQIDVTDKINCSAVYDGRIDIIIGKPIDLDYKAKMIAEVLNSESITEDTKGTIDAYYAATNNRTYFRPKY